MKQYIVARMQGRIFSFLLHDQKAAEIHCDSEYSDSLLGNIYIAKIKNIAKNIGAAFVEIAPGVTCHLALDDMKFPIYTKKGSSRLPQAGDELLVQVSREGIKTKFPSVTTNLTLHGKYVLLTTGNASISVSSKLSRARRAELVAFAKAAMQNEGGAPSCCEPDQGRGYGLLFRTNAGTADQNVLSLELSSLQNRYKTLMRQAKFRTCFSCLIQTSPSYVGRLSNLYDLDAERILTDDAALYREMHDYLALQHPEDLPKLAMYEDRMLPMKKLYSLERHLEQALNEKVWLNSGGYLVIQPTEALTVIDVNSGKFEGGKKPEAAFLKLNLEAASEIARQIRLRNLSGIIIVDFINMKEQASNDALLSFLSRELRRDPIPTSLVDMTKLSLVEITRKKKERSLAQCCSCTSVVTSFPQKKD